MIIPKLRYRCLGCSPTSVPSVIGYYPRFSRSLSHRTATRIATRIGTTRWQVPESRSHCSTSSGVISMTGIAFSWIGSTTAFGSVVMIENSVWSPMLGTRFVTRSRPRVAQIPAKKKGLLVGALEPAPDQGALRRVPIGLGESRRQNNAAMPKVEPATPKMVLQAPKVGPIAASKVGRPVRSISRCNV